MIAICTMGTLCSCSDDDKNGSGSGPDPIKNSYIVGTWVNANDPYDILTIDANGNWTENYTSYPSSRRIGEYTFDESTRTIIVSVKATEQNYAYTMTIFVQSHTSTSLSLICDTFSSGSKIYKKKDSGNINDYGDVDSKDLQMKQMLINKIWYKETNLGDNRIFCTYIRYTEASNYFGKVYVSDDTWNKYKNHPLALMYHVSTRDLKNGSVRESINNRDSEMGPYLLQNGRIVSITDGGVMDAYASTITQITDTKLVLTNYAGNDVIEYTIAPGNVIPPLK